MLKENEKKGTTDASVALLAAQLAQTEFADNAIQTSSIVQEMFELLMITEHGNQFDIRERAYIAMTNLREAAPIMAAFNAKMIAHV